MTNKEAIEILKPLTEYRVGKHGIATLPIVSAPLQVDALDLAIKALEEKVNDPRNDPHYAECKYCKHLELSSNDYPCCACGLAEEFKSKWERR